MFDIPIVLFIFRRQNTIPAIMERIAQVRPIKIYIMSDAGRNEFEKAEVEHCRRTVEDLITWECDVIKNYAVENRGVYKNIGEGAKWVFEREEKAIFIEDDNLPEISFFSYAKELLEKYENNDSILWVCGTNYFTEIEAEYSYVFTKHLLPCGWASWNRKFLKYYDGDLNHFKDTTKKKVFLKSYTSKLLAFYQLQSIKNEYFRKQHIKSFKSWDFQMLWSVRSNNLFGIMPLRNQITNIGVDDYSIHGGNSKSNIMTDRFCEIPSKEMESPLIHPSEVKIDERVETMIGEIICPPFKSAILKIITSKMKHVLGLDSNTSLKMFLRKRDS